MPQTKSIPIVDEYFMSILEQLIKDTHGTLEIPNTNHGISTLRQFFFVELKNKFIYSVIVNCKRRNNEEKHHSLRLHFYSHGNGKYQIDEI